jgi:membrane glycosyltransferase
MDGSLTNVVAFDSARAFDPARVETRSEPQWLPPEAPLAMPRHALQGAEARAETAVKAPVPDTSPKRIALRRTVLFGCTFVLAGLSSIVPFETYLRDGLEPLEAIAMVLFASLILGLSCWFVSAMAGFLNLVSGRDTDPIRFAETAPAPTVRSALLMPLYNEDAEASFARLKTIEASLAALGAADAFDIFVLSDTTSDAVAAEERLAFADFRRIARCRVWYRRRLKNTERKPGNLAEWVQRFGAAYAHMIVLDADSVMSGETILKLVDAMERHPKVGLIQTVPVIINARSLFGRSQQFGVKLYGRVASAGLAWWTGSEGSYWGHNAIVRVKAFAECCGLPHLKGSGPFGGAVLSHDVVEAGLLRRAGWGVHVTPRLDGSFEEAPPSLVEFLKRDRRWCQGNLQHLGLLTAPGFHWISRLQFVMGAMAYLVSPLWFAFLWTGLLIEIGRTSDIKVTVNPFSGPGLISPDTLPMIWSIVLTIVLLLGPKLLGFTLALLRREERKAFGGARRLIKGMVLESVVSAMLAPIIMVAHTLAITQILLGRDAGWGKQTREADGLGWREAFTGLQGHVLAGLAFIGALAFLPDLTGWFTPIVAPLLLAAPLAVWSSRSRIGGVVASFGLLKTPEDRHARDERPAAATVLELERLRA